MKRLAMIAMAGAALLSVGCAITPTVVRLAPPGSHGIGWVGQEWRVCGEGACPGATPKTMVIPAAVPAPKNRPAPTTKPGPAIERVPVSVHFDFAEAHLSKAGLAQLEQVLSLIQDGDSLRIQGRTDARGSTKFNNRLARQRADAIAAWLKQRGIKNPMEIEAQGRCCYVASNDSEEGRAANRRVEIHFISTKEVHP